MLTTWFANPDLLWTLQALSLCMLLFFYARFRRQRALALLGNTLPMRKQTLVAPRTRRWRNFALLLGIGLVGIACAGPQWGLDPSAQERKGRDVILVLDLSRSMLAEQPSRRTLALRALTNLADVFAKHGSNRIALVAFASQARLFFPLTQDYDHLRHTLTLIEEDDYARLSGPDPTHGTRIGAALKLAVQSLDSARVNRPVLVLLSDGDDPAGDDEWLQGALEARAKQIRVHTVGIGDPHKDETIPLADEIVKFGEHPVLTRLHESVMKEIARRTDGQYLPARSEREFPLGELIQHLLDADELREETPAEGVLPTYQLRYVWFLLPAVVLFLWSMLLNEGPVRARSVKPGANKPRIARSRRQSIALLVAVCAILGASAADRPTPEMLLRQGDEAFERQDYEAAIKHYENAEALTRDPGLVSFNKAAAHYKLGQFKEAIECYRRCVEDDGAAPERKARAFFDLGNALVQHAGSNPRTLAEAMAAYRACLHHPDLPRDLRAKARHNLELAQLLWLKLNPTEAPERTPRKDPFEEPKAQPSDDTYQKVDPLKKFVTKEADNVPVGEKSQTLHVVGSVTTLPESAKVDELPRDVALGMLAKEAERIANERRRQRNPNPSAVLSTKDW